MTLFQDNQKAIARSFRFFGSSGRVDGDLERIPVVDSLQGKASSERPGGVDGEAGKARDRAIGGSK